MVIKSDWPGLSRPLDQIPQSHMVLLMPVWVGLFLTSRFCLSVFVRGTVDGSLSCFSCSLQGNSPSLFSAPEIESLSLSLSLSTSYFEPRSDKHLGGLLRDSHLGDFLGKGQSSGRFNGRDTRQVSCLVCETLEELFPMPSRPVPKLWEVTAERVSAGRVAP
jgi:hypothetical protein